MLLLLAIAMWLTLNAALAGAAVWLSASGSELAEASGGPASAAGAA